MSFSITDNNSQLELMPPTVYDFDLNDFGNQLDFDKELMSGMVIIVQGISQQIFEGDFAKPARSLLFNFPSDPEGIAPWGIFVSEDSPVAKQTEQMVKRERTPFYARIVKQDSKRHKGQEYWTLERVSMQYNQDGVIIDPNIYPEPVTVESNGKKK